MNDCSKRLVFYIFRLCWAIKSGSLRNLRHGVGFIKVLFSFSKMHMPPTERMMLATNACAGAVLLFFGV